MNRPPRRPRAEDCERLTSTDLRGTVPSDAERAVLSDGTELELRWRQVKGCWGGKGGRTLLIACPRCRATVRVLWRPPGTGWGCWRCCPISHRSHRRSGSRPGKPKPLSWRLEQLMAEQQRTADLLGLAEWPPPALMWSWRDLVDAPRLPDAPRLSSERQEALLLRLDALETLRLSQVVPGICTDLRAMGCEPLAWPELPKQAAAADAVVQATAWAVRRPSREPRRLRIRRQRCG